MYFYAPLLQIIEPIEEYYNESNTSETVVLDAIRKGQIQYVNGKFKGKFTAKISQALRDLGAKFNKVTKTYNLSRDSLSISLLETIASANLLAMMRLKLINDFLDTFTIEKALPELQKLLNIPLETTLSDLDEQAQLTLKEAITIVPKINEETRKRLKEEYVENLTIPIKNFTQERTDKLRAMVEENLFTGLADNKILVKEIMKEFSVGENKARFWARQETGLLVAKYKQIEYESVGITKYRWSISHDERVRPFHKELNGQIFEFANPPIVNEKGDKKNPLEDYNCRCEAIPIIDWDII